MKVFIFLMLLILPIISKSQTCIMIASFGDTITIGADSRIGINDTRGKNVFSEDCKIRMEKNIYYTGAGAFMQILIPFSKQVIDKQKYFIDSIQFDGENLKKILDSSIENIRNSNFDYFLKNYKDSIGHLAFVWFYKDTPKCFLLSFYNISPPSDIVNVLIVPQKFNLFNKNRISFISLGETSALSQIEKTGMGFWENKPLRFGVLKYLKLQTKDTPEKVGSPYSVLNIYKNGKVWVSKGLCKW